MSSRHSDFALTETLHGKGSTCGLQFWQHFTQNYLMPWPGNFCANKPHIDQILRFAL